MGIMSSRLMYRGPTLAELQRDYAKQHRVDPEAPLVSVSKIDVAARCGLRPARERATCVRCPTADAASSAASGADPARCRRLSATETAKLLESTTASMNSAHNRARATLQERRAAGRLHTGLAVPSDAGAESLAQRCLDAWQAVDLGQLAGFAEERRRDGCACTKAALHRPRGRERSF